MAKHHRHEFHHKTKHMKHEKHHGHFAKGGKVGPKSDSAHPSQDEGGVENKGVDDYSGSGEPNVVKEAKGKKDKFKHGGKVMGHKSKSRMDKYARGGRTGGSPFSSAKIKENTDSAQRHKKPEVGAG
jgi:hypothetical protein